MKTRRWNAATAEPSSFSLSANSSFSRRKVLTTSQVAALIARLPKKLASTAKVVAVAVVVEAAADEEVAQFV